MAKVKITYEYRGTKAIPVKWFEGRVIEHRYEGCWYEGSEVVDESAARQRVKELEVIVNEYGKKKYRNIKIEAQ